MEHGRLLDRSRKRSYPESQLPSHASMRMIEPSVVCREIEPWRCSWPCSYLPKRGGPVTGLLPHGRYQSDGGPSPALPRADEVTLEPGEDETRYELALATDRARCRFGHESPLRSPTERSRRRLGGRVLCRHQWRDLVTGIQDHSASATFDVRLTRRTRRRRLWDGVDGIQHTQDRVTGGSRPRQDDLDELVGVGFGDRTSS